MASVRTLELEIEAALAHDLRNSVAALRLLVEAVRDGVIEATPGSSTVDQMLAHVRLLGALLDAQSDGREHRRGSPAPRAVSIASLLAQWTDAMSLTARQRQVGLQLVVAPDLPEVECRPDQISRVLLNLIGHAIRHAPAGGCVVVRGLSHPGGVQIQVEDSGTGLRPDGCAERPDMPPRATAPRRADAKCADGIGLAIARTIVQAHGGALWAGSPPRSTSLRFYLPATVSAV